MWQQIIKKAYLRQGIKGKLVQTDRIWRINRSGLPLCKCKGQGENISCMARGRGFHAVTKEAVAIFTGHTRIQKTS